MNESLPGLAQPDAMARLPRYDDVLPEYISMLLSLSSCGWLHTWHYHCENS